MAPFSVIIQNMIPVYQKRVSKGNGDCMQAALASLLEIDYDEVPDLINVHRWADALERFLKKHGYHVRTVISAPIDRELFGFKGVDGFFWASVVSPGFGLPTTHAVLVDKHMTVVHDPNPKYKDFNDYEFVYVRVIEKIDD